MQLHIIYTEEAVFLSKRAYPSWREIQDGYAGYKASLGPWASHAMIEFLVDEYSTISPSAHSQVTALLDSKEDTTRITFSDR